MMMQSTADVNIINSMNPEIEPARTGINGDVVATEIAIHNSIIIIIKQKILCTYVAPT